MEVVQRWKRHKKEAEPTKDDTQNFRLSGWVNGGAPNQK